MYAAPGVGLAAPQVGENIRMLVLDTRPLDENDQVITEKMTELEKAINYPLVLVNPEIIQKDGKICWEEGCLSVPGFYEEVDRFAYVEVRYQDLDGKERILSADRLLGVCIQHEIDHLDGKIFIEKLSQLKFDRIRTRIKKYGYESPEDEEMDAK
jgi:peptide deformylase